MSSFSRFRLDTTPPGTSNLNGEAFHSFPTTTPSPTSGMLSFQTNEIRTIPASTGTMGSGSATEPVDVREPSPDTSEPRAQPQEPQPDPDNALLVTVFIVILTPASSAKSKKKDTSVTLGPTKVDVDITFDSFLASIAKVVKTRKSLLVVDSIKWKPFTPQNSRYLPLTDDEGLRAMMTRVGPFIESNRMVYVQMDKPKKLENDWELTEDELTTTAHSGSSGSTAIVQTGKRSSAALTEASDGEEVDSRPTVKKGKLDSELEAIKEKLKDRYKIGSHPGYPSIRVFHHTKTGQLFDLIEARLTSWASKIGRNEATLDDAPIGSYLWKPENAMRKKTTAAEAVPSPSTPMPPAPAPTPTLASTPTAPQMAHPMMMSPYAGLPMMFPPSPWGFNPYQMPMPSYPQHTMPMSPFNPSSSHHPKAYDGVRSSSPVPDSTLPLDEFISLYRLDRPDQGVEEKLNSLQFVPGDNLNKVLQSEWEKAGFTSLSWDRVVKANQKYLKELKEQS